MPDTRASNPTSSGPALLDKSTARPGEVDMAIFEKNQAQSGSASAGASQKSQGAVNPNYLEECRRDNPAPADEKTAKRTVTLSDCRIDTPPEDLATDQPFKMSCMATSSDGKPVTNGVTFRLYCTLPDGTEEDTGLAKVGKREGDRICAEGTLYSPKKLVEWGEVLKFRVVAEHGESGGKEKSGEMEMVGYMPPKPLAVWVFDTELFDHNTALILPSAKNIFSQIEYFFSVHKDAVVSIHANYEGALPFARAFSLFCVLIGADDLFENHLLGQESTDGWVEYCAFIMFDYLFHLGKAPEDYLGITEKYLSSLFASHLDFSQILGVVDRRIQLSKTCSVKSHFGHCVNDPELHEADSDGYNQGRVGGVRADIPWGADVYVMAFNKNVRLGYCCGLQPICAHRMIVPQSGRNTRMSGN